MKLLVGIQGKVNISVNWINSNSSIVVCRSGVALM